VRNQGTPPHRAEVHVLGELVRAHRRRLSMTQEELAERAAISVRTIRAIESGRIPHPRQTTVRELADALDLSDTARQRLYDAASAPSQRPASADDTGDRDNDPAAATGAGVGLPIPAQIPADLVSFTGRHEHLRRLSGMLDVPALSATAVVITTIAGMAGVGKTALAVHWAHRVASRFPDGQLYVNLRGFGPVEAMVRPEQAIRGFFDALGVPPERIPADLPAQTALFRSLIAGRRLLVLLDNARNSDHARPLLPGSPGCAAIVTSRDRLAGLITHEGAHPINLDPLGPGEARQLLVRRLGARRLVAESPAVDDIVDRCAGLPLALSVVAARVATHPQLPLRVIADELRDSEHRLDGFDGGEPGVNVRAVFSWSYRALSPPAARLFRLVGLHFGPDVTVPVAASLAAVPLRQVRPLIAELTEVHLLNQHARGRYTCHDLLRAYAGELAPAVDTDADRRAALHRVLDHYLHTGFAAARLLRPRRYPIQICGPSPGVTAADLNEPDQAPAWFTTEESALVGAVHAANSHGFDAHTWQLAWVLEDFLAWKGDWRRLHDMQRIAVAAADRLADPTAQARARSGLSRACVLLDAVDEAEDHLRAALRSAEATGDRVLAAWYHLNFGPLLRQFPERWAEGIEHSRRALELFRANGHSPEEGIALNQLGYALARLGDYRQAIECCREALSLLPPEDLVDQAHTWHSLGFAHHRARLYAEAVTCFQHALDHFREAGRQREEATTLAGIGDAHEAAGEPEAARCAWREALGILERLEHPDIDRVRAKLDHAITTPAAESHLAP
jgi:tetratricopeptide (TPR) repeat protein/transcriptional regulator with XRE-family HTH domain